MVKYTKDKREKMVSLSKELGSVELSLDGKNLLAETSEKLNETKQKYLDMFDELFDVRYIREACRS